MSHENKFSFAGAASVAGLAMLMLILPAAGRAAIVIQDAVQNYGSQFSAAGGTQSSPDGVISANEPFAVSSGASVLVVQYSEFANSNTGPDATTTITWNGQQSHSCHCPDKC